jgi:hypothetical protein
MLDIAGTRFRGVLVRPGVYVEWLSGTVVAVAGIVPPLSIQAQGPELTVDQHQQMSKLGFEGYNLLKPHPTHQPPNWAPQVGGDYNLQKPTETPGTSGGF